VLLVLVGSAAAGAVWYGVRVFRAPGPLASARVVVIPHGLPAQVADALTQAGVIAHPLVFRLAAEVTGSAEKLHAGELAFAANASLEQVLDTLRTARPVQHRLTIPEGLTAAQIVRLFDRAEALTGDMPVLAEGSLLPSTYAYELGTTRAALLERAQAAMQKTVERIWAQRDPDLPLTDPAQLVTLASMVERETARPEERPHIAGVFVNRMRRGMKLQSDPTVAYALSGGAVSADATLTRADIDLVSPYNTYRIVGLPPGAIDSPGLASLEAVARPEHTDDLYFVVDGTGGHVFARTLEEHLKNVARWRTGEAATRALGP
jgi:UPF0755 protein